MRLPWKTVFNISLIKFIWLNIWKIFCGIHLQKKFVPLQWTNMYVFIWLGGGRYYVLSNKKNIWKLTVITLFVTIKAKGIVKIVYHPLVLSKNSEIKQ